MKFRIVEAPEELLRSTSAIPFHYCGSLSSFAKPKFMASPQLDIVYQRVVVKGCILRHMTLYVRQPVTLVTSDRNPMITINCMLKGNIGIQLNGMNKITVSQNDYFILQMNTDDHALLLSPGVYELVRCDYTNRIIRKERPEWEAGLDNNESAIHENGVIGAELVNRIQELKHATISTPENEDWLYRKLRKFLRIVLEEHQLLNE